MGESPSSARSVPEARVSPLRSLSAIGRVVLVMTCAVTAALAASNNWCWIAIPVVLAAGLVDYVVCCAARWLLVRAAVAVVVGAAVGMLLRVRPGWAFDEVFGIESPSGVRDVRVWRHYAGGPGEHVLIIEFTAEPEAVRTLSSLHALDADDDRVARWREAGAGWAKAFEIFVPTDRPGFGRSTWMRLRPIEEPQVFDFGPVRALRGRLTMLHEPSTGRCVALHVRF